MDVKNTITDFWGELTDAGLENEFRRRELANELSRAKMLLVLTSIIVMLLGINDYFLFRFNQPFWTLMVVRVVIGTLSMGTLYSILRKATPQKMEKIMLVWGLLYILLVLYVDSTRPEQFLNGSILDVIVLLTVYLGTSTRLKLQTLPAVVYTAGNFIMLASKPNLTNLVISSTVSIILSANFSGFALAWLLNRGARQQFLSLKSEEALREQLEIALTEIRSLEGLLPICSYCRNIRDGDGTWKGVEQYVSERSGAKFSSGVCPSCEKKGKEVSSSRFPVSS